MLEPVKAPRRITREELLHCKAAFMACSDWVVERSADGGGTVYVGNHNGWQFWLGCETPMYAGAAIHDERDIQTQFSEKLSKTWFEHVAQSLMELN